MRKGKFARTAVAAIVIAALATLSLPTSQADNIVDEQIGRLAPPTTDAGWIGVDADDSNTLVMPTLLRAGTSDRIEAGGGQLCSSITTGACADSNNLVSFNLFLPECTTDAQTDCIESLKATDSSGNTVTGAMKSYFPAESSPNVVGSSALGIPDGWNPSLWTFPGITHAGGSDFLLAASVLSFGAPAAKPGDHLELEAALYPVSEVATSDTYHGPINGVSDDHPEYHINSDQCPIFLGNNQCATAWPFPANVKFQITIRTSGPISGWIHGRIDKPDVSVSSFGPNGTRIQISGGSEVVPVFASWQKYANLPSDFKNFLNTLSLPQKGNIYTYNWPSIWDGSGVAPYSKLSIEHDIDNYDDANFKEFQYFLGMSDNKSIADKSQWAFYTGFTGDRSTKDAWQNCQNSTSSLNGVVTTNSTMYLDAPPTYDPTTGTLNYQVSSPHFNRQGVANVGHYDLLINSDIARCLYHFTNAPVQASVQVVDSDGTTQVATSVLNESNGFLHLSVSGFGYSAPTLKVKLTQDAPTPAPSASPSPTPSPSVSAIPSPSPSPKSPKKVTITCVKGKSSKSVSGVSPVCPSGYKRK